MGLLQIEIYIWLQLHEPNIFQLLLPFLSLHFITIKVLILLIISIFSVNTLYLFSNLTFLCVYNVADSPQLSLLIQNKGKGPLTVKISAPDFVHLEKSEVQLQEKEDKKVFRPFHMMLKKS